MALGKDFPDINNNLEERNKELNCIYKISKHLKDSYELANEVITRILKLIQSAMEFPSMSCVMIRVNDHEHTTQDFKKTQWKISSNVSENETEIIIEVCCREDKQFLNEKVVLIEEIAFKLKTFIKQLEHKEQLKLIKKTQNDLRESERKFRVLYENAPLAYQSLDYRGNILDVNDAWLNFMGYTKEEVIGKEFGDFIDPEYLKVLQTRFPKFKEEGEVREIEYEVIKKNGNHAIVSFNGQIGYDENMNFERTHCIFQDITDHKKMEQKLKESEEKFRNITEQSLMGIAIIQDDVVKYATERLAEIYGYSVEELLNFEPNGFLKLIDPEFLEIVREQAVKKQLGQKDIITNYEVRGVKKTGEKFWVENFSKTIIFNGKPADLVTNIDITERKETEQKLKNSEETLRVLNDQLEQKVVERTEELKESEKKYKELFNHMTSGVAVYDALEEGRDFIIKDINKAGQKIDNILKEDVIDKKVSEAFPGVKDFGLFDVFKRVWKTSIPENHPISFYKDERVSHWVENYVYKLPTGEIVAVYDNVTEKKIAEQRLKESEEKFRSTFEQAAVGIAHVAPDGKFLRVNQKWCDIVGYTPEEMILRTFQEITHPDDLDADLEFVRQMLDKEISTYSMQKRYFHKDGSTVWINLTVALLFNPSGEPKYFISVIEDITERLEIEQRFKTIFMNSPIGIELYNSEGKLLNINRSCLDIFGVSSIDSVKGFDLFQDPNLSEEFKKKLLKGENVRYEMTFDFEKVKELKLYETSKSGIIYLDVTITPLYLNTPELASNFLVQIQDITVNKQAEHKLRNLNAELEDKVKDRTHELMEERNLANILIDNMPCMALLIKSNTREIVASNQHGRDVGAVPGKTCFGTWGQREDPCPWCLAPKVWETGKPQHLEVEALDIVWDAHWIPIREDLYFHYAFDITERKKSEVKLQESENFLRYVHEIVELGFWDWNIITGELIWSDETFRIYGFKPQEFIPTFEKFRSIIHPNDIDYVQSQLDSVFQNDIKYDLDFRFVRPNGEIGFINVKGDVTRDKKGNPIRFVGTQIDITERKKREEELRLQSEIIINLSEGVYLIRVDDGIIVYANPRFEEMFGYDPGEMIGKYVSIVNAPTDKTPEETKQDIMGILLETGEWHGEVNNIKKDGTRFWCYANVSLFDHPEYGKVIVSIHTDITERKKAVEDLKKKSHELGERVKELTCLFNLSKVTEQLEVSMENLIIETIKLIPPAWQFPEITCTRIILNGQEFSSDNFLSTKWKLQAYIKKGGNVIGTVEVYYLKEMPDFEEGPFLKEERNLVDAIAEILGGFIERKFAAQNLKESEELFSKAFHSSPNLMSITRLEDGHFIDINDTYIQTLGYSREELIGHSSIELNLWANPKQRNDMVKIVQEHKRISHFEVQVQKKSEKILYMLFSGEIITLNNKPHLIAIASDITERKKAERKLKESEERYRTLFENMNDGFAYHKIILDEGNRPINYTFLEANPAFEELTRLKVDEIIGKKVREIIPGIEKDPFDWIGKYGKVALTGIPIKFESYSEPLNRWYNVSAYSPKKGFFATIFSDITERKKSEEELLIKNYALYSSINAIAISNLVGDLTYINPSFLEMWGYLSEEEVLGKKSTSFWASEEKANEVVSHIRKKRSWSGDLIGKRKNGTLFDAFLSVNLVADKNNKPICLMGTFLDITERKRAEQLIIEENRKLKELGKMKRDIITRVSHELKTPLTSIHGASYYLLNFYREEMSKDVLEYTEIIHRGGLRLKSLVDDLIDTSRIEAGKLVLKKEEANVVQMIEECMKDMGYIASFRKIAMRTNMPEQLSIRVDNIRISQVISNILSNAIKNTPAYGEVSVEIKENIDTIDIQIKDQGVGITRDERLLLFKKFGKIERYGKGLDVDIEGSGLGLFIAKEIVDLHNGDIFFESEGRNKGVTFTIRLPKI